MNDSIQTGPAMDEAIGKTAQARRGLRAYNRLGWALIVLLAAMAGLPSVIGIVISNINPALLNSPFFGLPVTYLCMYLVGFPLMLLLLRGIPNAPAKPAQGDGKKITPLQMLALYPVLYAVVGLISMATTAIESFLGTNATATVQDIIAMPLPQWVTFLLGVIVAPVMEEIIFRRLVYQKASGYGKAAFVLWSAVVFGVFHLNFGQSLYAAALGAVFALIMLKTGSVVYPAILHIAINLTGGIGLGSILLGSGNETAIAVYSIYTIALLVIGTVIGIVMVVRLLRAAKGRQAETPIIRKWSAFLNPGSIVYCVICLAFIVSGFFL